MRVDNSGAGRGVSAPTVAGRGRIIYALTMIKKLRICHHCAVVLNRDECAHYVYQCSACVIAEHDLLLRWHGGDDHPELERLFTGPVEIAGVFQRPRVRGAEPERTWPDTEAA